MNKLEARTKIIQAANVFKLESSRKRGHWYPVRILSPKHIQQAVNVCRQNLLVDGATLNAAGFNAVKRNG